VVGVTGDPIDEYLARLRAGLRASPERAGQIVAEAEDHLRSSAAAGLAAGMSEREAQEAAIAAFGRVPAVVRSHRRPGSVLAELGLAAMKLTAIYLLAVPLAGLSGVVLRNAVIEVVVAPGMTVVLAPINYARAAGVLAASAAVGLALLACYRMARGRRGQGTRRLGIVAPGALLGGYFPLAAVIGMFVAGFFLIPLLSRVRFPGESLVWAAGIIPFAAVFGAVAVAVGYAIAMVWVLVRRRDTGERVPYAR
jgi:hypothetical protein